MESLPALLYNLRKAKGYSLRQVEDLSDNAISHGYLNLLEKGFDGRTGKRINPSTRILKVLAKVYQYPYTKLLQAAGYVSPPLEERTVSRFGHTLEEIMDRYTVYFKGAILSNEDKKDLLRILDVVWDVVKSRQNQ